MMELTRAVDAYERLVRGDAMIGLIPDVPALEGEMMSGLRAAAHQGSAKAYLYLGHVFAAGVQPQGAFRGVPPSDLDTPLWSQASLAFRFPMMPAMEAAQRAYYEAALRGERQSLRPLAMLSRMSSKAQIGLILDQLKALDEPSGEELLLRGWVQNWLGEMQASFVDVQRAAQAGYPPAQFELSLYFNQGLGTEPDPQAAQVWEDRAAEQGNPRALYNRGAALATGKYGTLDPERAAADYQAAAEQGHIKAATTLAAMILKGDVQGTPADAIPWLNQAEEQGFDVFSLLYDLDLKDPR